MYIIHTCTNTIWLFIRNLFNLNSSPHFLWTLFIYNRIVHLSLHTTSLVYNYSAPVHSSFNTYVTGLSTFVYTILFLKCIIKVPLYIIHLTHIICYRLEHLCLHYIIPKVYNQSAPVHYSFNTYFTGLSTFVYTILV